MPLRDAQQVFAKDDLLDAIDVLVVDGFRVGAVEEAVTNQVAGRAIVASPLERTAGLERTLNSIFSMLIIAGWISLFAGASIIYTNVSMSIVERRKSLAIMRALGMRRSEVVGVVLSEVATVGLLASGLGLLMGYGLASGLATQVAEQFATLAGTETAVLRLTGQDLAIALGLGLGMSLVAALVPTRATVRIDPVEAMRPESSDLNGAGRGNALRPIIGLVLLGAPAVLVWRTWPAMGEVSSRTFEVWGASALVMLLGAALTVQAVLPLVSGVVLRPFLRLLFGITGRLAADNLARQPRRAAASSLALMVALAYLVGMGGFTAAMTGFNEKFIEKTVGWDLWVGTSIVSPSPALVDLPATMGDELANVPGVTVVDPAKFNVASLSDGHPINLQVFDFRVMPRHAELLLVQGSQEEALSAMRRGGSAIISSGLARELGLNVGDRISIPSPSGVQDFTVVAVDQEPAPAGGAVLLDRQDYTRYWNDEGVTAFVLKTEPGRQEEVRQAILSRWGESMDLTVTLKDEFWAEVRQGANALTGMITGLAWLSIAIAGLAVANTLFSNLMERMREFGALRAVGARRRDVTQVVVGEAVATGVIGGALGIAGGLGLYTLFVRSSEVLTGFPADLAVPWVQIGMALVAALVLAPLVGLLPARWAASMEIVEALRYE
jgi:putative ABC transport system permease protein